MKYVNRLCSICCAAIIIYISIICVFYSFIIQKDFFVRNCNKYDVAYNLKMSDEELEKVINFMISTVKGKSKEDNISVIIESKKVLFFNQREINHLNDISLILKKVNITIVISVFVMICTLLSLYKSKQIIKVATSFLGIEILILGIGISVAIYTAINPLDAINKFHKIIFKNNLWILNPAKDRLIFLFPKVLFVNAAFTILLWMFFILSIESAICIFIILHRSRRFEKYIIKYSCISDIGKKRAINQDNYICKNIILSKESNGREIKGKTNNNNTSTFGVFDGMGGEACGEVASRIVARTALEYKFKGYNKSNLINFFRLSNKRICDYALKNGAISMGTTAAIVVFGKKQIAVCNIGDTKIFCFSDGKLSQISKDHITVAPYGIKPPLMQYLGIPEDEMIIDPYLFKCDYKVGDIYLICSDGLTDAVKESEIRNVLDTACFADGTKILLDMALKRGGKDNITIILCKIEHIESI